MEYLLVSLGFVVIIALLSWSLGRGKGSAGSKNKQNEKAKVRPEHPVKCPVCNSELFTGENLVSRIYRPMNVPDQLMSIMGCPHCYPKCEKGIKRYCPVCKQELGAEDALVARLFNRSTGKKHVHVVGCSKCHKNN